MKWRKYTHIAFADDDRGVFCSWNHDVLIAGRWDGTSKEVTGEKISTWMRNDSLLTGYLWNDRGPICLSFWPGHICSRSCSSCDGGFGC